MEFTRLFNRNLIDRYHIETSPLICGGNQWTGFYMITVFVIKELKKSILKSNNKDRNYSIR